MYLTFRGWSSSADAQFQQGMQCRRQAKSAGQLRSTSQNTVIVASGRAVYLEAWQHSSRDAVALANLHPVPAAYGQMTWLLPAQCCELDYKGMDLSFVRFSLSTRPLAWAFVTQINNKHEFPHRPDRNPDCRSTCRLLTRANVTSLAGSSLVSRMRRCLAE